MIEDDGREAGLRISRHMPLAWRDMIFDFGQLFEICEPATPRQQETARPGRRRNKIRYLRLMISEYIAGIDTRATIAILYA